jgi:hypothetical protein
MEKKMNARRYTDHPPRWIQLPVRLESPLADALDRYSKMTRISKSEITRSSIRRFINDLEQTGISSALEKIHTN